MSKTPTIKRILREAAELSSAPSPDYHAAPLETNLFEWHFTLRGPPAPSPFAHGIYHGRIVLPPSYPLRPPSFRFLTPSGRFEVNREICLSISGFHEESWQPAWGVRTALVAIRSFMTEDAKGQVGGMSAADAVRRRLAGESAAWRCVGCGAVCGDVLRAQEERCREEGGVDGALGKEEVVPEGLRLGYQDELGKGEGGAGGEEGAVAAATEMAETAKMDAVVEGTEAETTQVQNESPARSTTAATIAVPPSPPPPAVVSPVQAQQRRAPVQAQQGVPEWIDKAIIGVVVALLIMVWKKFAA